MSKCNDLTGKRFGRLFVIKRVGSNKFNKSIWLCKCDCGNEKIITGTLLRIGETTSCGCFNRERLIETSKEANTTHGKRYTTLYHIWRGIKLRCLNEKNPNYKYYGSRGIKICDEWKDNFQAFYNWSIDNGYNEEKLPSGRNKLTIDRIDIDGDYTPSNCRFITYKQQNRNRRNNKRITYNNQTLTLVEWCEILNLPYDRVQQRIYKGMSFEKAMCDTDYRRKAVD
jgi:hypothetical protein